MEIIELSGEAEYFEVIHMQIVTERHRFCISKNRELKLALITFQNQSNSKNYFL